MRLALALIVFVVLCEWAVLHGIAKDQALIAAQAVALANCPKLQVSALADYYAVECSFVDGQNWSIHCRRNAAY